MSPEKRPDIMMRIATMMNETHEGLTVKPLSSAATGAAPRASTAKPRAVVATDRRGGAAAPLRVFRLAA